MAQKHHVEVDGFPEDFVPPRGRVYLRTSGTHVQDRAMNSRYLKEDEDMLVIPQSVEVTPDEIFEMEMEGGTPKICVRTDYDGENRDIIYAIRMDGSIADPYDECLLKTMWINLKDDTHETLDRSAYGD
jgi:hypothetical protein